MITTIAFDICVLAHLPNTTPHQTTAYWIKIIHSQALHLILQTALIDNCSSKHSISVMKRLFFTSYFGKYIYIYIYIYIYPPSLFLSGYSVNKSGSKHTRKHLFTIISEGFPPLYISLSLSIYLSICLSIYISIYLSIYLSISQATVWRKWL